MGNRPPFYDSEFKFVAVELLYGKGTAASVAKELGIKETLAGSSEEPPRFNTRIDKLTLGSNRISLDNNNRNLELENKLLIRKQVRRVRDRRCSKYRPKGKLSGQQRNGEFSQNS